MFMKAWFEFFLKFSLGRKKNYFCSYQTFFVFSCDLFLTAHPLPISGKPLCVAVCGLCPPKSRGVHPRLPRGTVCVQRAQV